jgi:aspartate racemase
LGSSYDKTFLVAGGFLQLPISSSRSVGVLGGMGPLATVDYLQKIIDETPAGCDQEHVPCVVVSIPQTPDRSNCILSNGSSPLEAMLLGVRSLELAGAGCVTIACNTAHHWSQQISAQTNLPLLHIADAVLAELSATSSYGDSIGILSTMGTLKSGFYQRRLQDMGYRVTLNAEKETSDWVSRGILLTKQGRVIEGGHFLGLAAQALRERGCDRLLLGCTEIPVALSRVNHESLAYSLDATRALAQTAVAWWQNKV